MLLDFDLVMTYTGLSVHTCQHIKIHKNLYDSPQNPKRDYH